MKKTIRYISVILLLATSALFADNFSQLELKRIYSELLVTDFYKPAWNDKGSGANQDVSFWIPTPDASHGAFGHRCRPGYESPASTRDYTLSRKSPLLQPPLDYELVWTDKGSGAETDGSIWRLVCPLEFVALGMVARQGYNKPGAKTEVLCVSRRIVRPSTIAGQLWNDKGSGADQDLSVWSIKGSPYFYAHNSHKKPGPLTRVWKLDPNIKPSVGFARKRHRFKIEFDYRFAGPFFKDPAKRRTLEAAANIWGRIISSDFPRVPAGRVIKVSNPATGQVEKVTLEKPIDDLRIFVFAYDFNSSTKAVGGHFGSWTRGSQFERRYKGPRFQPWVGKLSINTKAGRPWFFDQTPETDDDIPSRTH